jgi:hypothetical protein
MNTQKPTKIRKLKPSTEQRPGAKTERNRRKRQRRAAKRQVAKGNAIPNQMGGNNKLARRIQLAPHDRKKLSQAGLNFLKCAFAPPDFQADMAEGIPDNVQTRRLLKRHRNVGAIKFVAGLDYYIIQVPIPGVSYMLATVAAGTPILQTTVFQAVPYSDYATLFGTPGQESNIVDRFRFVSSCFEVVPTANEMTWSGNIECFKAPITLHGTGVLISAEVVEYQTIGGLQSLNATNPDCYVAGFNKGLFTQTFKNTANFEWSGIVENNNAWPSNIAPSDFGQFIGATGQGLVGYGNMDAIVIKVSGINVAETAIIKTWACVEYSVVVGTILYEYAKMGPMPDDFAIELYNKICRDIPIGVTCAENENFWRRVLTIIRSATSAGSMLPGPYGMAFQGANMVANAVEALTIN